MAINNTPLEEEEQMALVDYLEIRGLKFTAIPNSTFTKSWKQKMKNTRTGLRPGLPDLLVIVKDKLIFIEMKRVKGGTVSETQKEWIEALSKCEGVNAYVAKGFDEARVIVDNLLK